MDRIDESSLPFPPLDDCMETENGRTSGDIKRAQLGHCCIADSSEGKKDLKGEKCVTENGYVL